MVIYEKNGMAKLVPENSRGREEDRLLAARRMRSFNDTSPVEEKKRSIILKDITGSVCKAHVEAPFYFSFGRNLQFGEGAYINMGCTFYDDGPIIIGDRTIIGPQVTITTLGHPASMNYRRYRYALPVVIGEDCFIDAGVTIGPGVTIGEHTVILPGSVVLDSLPADVIAGGNPCQVLRPIGPEEEQKIAEDPPEPEPEETEETEKAEEEK